MSYENEYMSGDCLTILKQVPNNTFDLIITSPPYADSRKNTYGGIHPDNYVQWFLPRANEFLRTLKPTGTFILNIKEKSVNGERHTYVIDLIKALRTQGWIWTEEFVWHKRNTHPGKWPNRFRDAWERCLQFNKSKNFAMFQDSVKIPIGDWSKSRLAKLSEADLRRTQSNAGSGFGKNVSNWLGKTDVYPSNVLHLATECGNKNHSAVFPVSLPTFFIKLFTKEDDFVLDPFAGSGTTAVACQNLDRRFLMIDIVPAYKNYAQQRLNNETNKDGISSKIRGEEYRKIPQKQIKVFTRN